MKRWITQTGEAIPYEKIGNSHLSNILRYIEKKAEEGVDIMLSGGYCGDDDFITGDVDTIYGNDVMEQMDYNGLKKELEIRKNLP